MKIEGKDYNWPFQVGSFVVVYYCSVFMLFISGFTAADLGLNKSSYIGKLWQK